MQEVHGTLAQQADARARALGVVPLGGTAAATVAPAHEGDDGDGDDGDDEQPNAPQVAPSGG
jgi:hypothetical protein